MFGKKWAKPTDEEMLNYWKQELKRFEKKDDVISVLNQKVCKANIALYTKRLSQDKHNNKTPGKTAKTPKKK